LRPQTTRSKSLVAGRWHHPLDTVPLATSRGAMRPSARALSVMVVATHLSALALRVHPSVQGPLAPRGAWQGVPAALRHGLAFVKTPKTGGTTFGGVMRRIGARHGMARAHSGPWLNELTTAAPSVWANHGRRQEIAKSLARQMPGAFLVTIVRDPIARCLSQFYHFQVHMRGGKPTEANKLSFIRRRCAGDYLVNYTKPAQGTAPAAVMDSYDFVATTERFDESLLLLAKKLGVKQVDLLYVPSKVSGTSVNETGSPMHEHPPFSSEPQSVQQLAEERMQHKGDAKLHEAADRALDEQAAAYGPSFKTELAEFQRRLAVLAATCTQHFKEGCLWKDNGCGQDCIDSVAEANHWD